MLTKICWQHGNIESGPKDKIVFFTCPCPFDLVVDHDPDRIPEKIFQQICLGCPSCGPFRTCTQTMLPYEVYYRSTNETAILEIRASCVCIMLDMGSIANSLDL